MNPGMTPAESKRWWAKQRALRQASRDLRELALQQIESRYELESDEGGTAREKAERIARAQ